MSVTQCLYHPIDTRMNVYELDNLPEEVKKIGYPDLDKIKENVAAVGCLIKMENLKETPHTYELHDKVERLSKRLEIAFGVPLAPQEKFPLEPTPGDGTAFLIPSLKKNLMWTAGHCVCIADDTSRLLTSAELGQMRVVFGYDKTDKNINKEEFPKQDVYCIKKVIKHSYKWQDASVADWALVKLDRPVTGRKPLQVNFSPKVGNSLYTAGCPMGMAVKTAGLNYAHIKSVGPKFMEADTDTLGGNSGSPNIDRLKNKVVAIHIRGQPHYIRSTGQQYVVSRRISPQMIQANVGSYAISQRIFPEMLDIQMCAARKGRRMRKESSDKASENFESNLKDLITEDEETREKIGSLAAIAMVTTPINPWNLLFSMPAAVVVGVWEAKVALMGPSKEIKELQANLKTYQAIRRRYDNRINLLEARHACGINFIPYSKKNERYILRNMAAFGISVADALKIFQYERDFEFNFSPYKIKDLIDYQKSRNLNISSTDARAVLKRMQKRDPDHAHVNSSSTVRMQAVVEAWFLVTEKSLSK